MRCYNLESEIEVYFLMAVLIGAHDKVAAAQTIWAVKWVVSAAVDNVCVCVCVCDDTVVREPVKEFIFLGKKCKS